MYKPPSALTSWFAFSHSGRSSSIAFLSSSGLASVPTFFNARCSSEPPNLISVPRPAMLVEIVTAPFEPASPIMKASRAWFLAFNTSCLIPALLKRAERTSDFSIDTVPINTG